MVVGPVLAIGLYEKSRRIARNQPTTLTRMIFVKADSGGQILFIGVILCGLMLLWMRAAVIVYALFFGLRPFPGLDHIAPMLFHTRSEEHTSELQSLMRLSYAVFCLKTKTT